MSIFMSWIVLIISVACAIGIMRIIHSVKKIERFFLTNNSTNKTPD
ncbi:hypothetical protein [Escherichia coli]|nr:hypothetical protein [Escherichia coli]EHS3806201.1 hypothetical protein [Escherichia coli]EIN2312020.1 hypothetical protein [Escherichia coli]EMA1381808.1 hypothetical protein [Escherichia coli]MDW6193499.1 hypothetical protein [Escherichia coli]MEB7182019.1 hypothetical protein [Escherichia coli]